MYLKINTYIIVMRCIVYEIDKNYINNISWLRPMAEGERREVSALYIYDNELNVHLIVIDYPFHEE